MQTKALRLPIYLDHNATTPLDARVLKAMEPYLRESFGNASSTSHAYGWQAQSAVKKAREQVARLLNCRPAHVTFTSGATESNNLAILGLLRAFKGQKVHLITQATEHKAILEVFEAAEEDGAEITVLPVDSEGLVRPADLAAAIKNNTKLCSIMMANNEIGTLQPLAALIEICRARKVIFHSDGAQSVGKYPVDLEQLSLDMLSLSGHKIYGPKGVGALVVRPITTPFELKPIQFGGEQENKLRPGTLNIAGIVGLGEACAVAQEVMTEESHRLRAFQNQILEWMGSRFPRVKLNGPRQNRLCNNLNFSFPDVMPDALVLGLSGVAFSSSSACSSGSGKASHVLKALGLDDRLAFASIRLGMGRTTTAEDVAEVTAKLSKMLEKSYPS